MKISMKSGFPLLLFHLLLIGTVADFSRAETTPFLNGSSNPSQKVETAYLAREFVEFLKSRSQWPEEAVEISSIRIFPSTIWVPPGELSVEILPPRRGHYLGRVSSTISIKIDGVEVRRARASAYIEVYQPVVTASRQIRKGEVITQADLSERFMPISRLRGRFIQDFAEVEGKAARRTIRSGQVIDADLLRPPTVLKRGQRVMIVAASKALEIKVPGEVMEDGGIGDSIRVRNLMSRKLIIGRVADNCTVTVAF